MQAVEQGYKAKQNQMLIHAIPDWTNQRIFMDDKASMMNTLQGYGVSEADLDSVTDHRIIKIVYDYNRLLNRVNKAAKANKAAQSKSKANKRTPKNKAPIVKPTQKPRENLGGNFEQQMTDIDALLR